MQISLLEADCTTREEKTLRAEAADWSTGKLRAQRLTWHSVDRVAPNAEKEREMIANRGQG